MSKPARRGLSIFARTFVLLAVALLTAQAVGIALLVMRTPIYEPPVHPPEVVALLSTRMPAGTQTLQVHESAQAPTAPAADQVRDPFAEMLLAHWLNVPEQRVRFYRSANDREGPRLGMPGPQPMPPFPGNWPRERQSGEPPFGNGLRPDDENKIIH